MKKVIMALLAAMTMSANVMAQQNEQEQVEQRRQQPNRTEMVKKRTEQMVEKYKLNETQAAQLLELNMRYAEKMGPMGGPRGQRGGQRADRPQQREKKDVPADTTYRQKRPQGQGEQGAGNRRAGSEEMRKNMEAYDKELQSILTEEQYQAYKNDNKRRGPQGNRGERRHQRQNSNE